MDSKKKLFYDSDDDEINELSEFELAAIKEEKKKLGVGMVEVFDWRDVMEKIHLILMIFHLFL